MHKPLVVLLSLFFLLAVSHPARAEVLKRTFANGLKVVIVPNRLAHAVAVQVDYRVGADETPPGFPGMAHAQEHMMFRGSPGLPAQQMSTAIAAMGGEFNADTGQTVTRYTSTVAAEDLDGVLRLEASRMRGILDSASAWNDERGAIIQEVQQDLSEPEYLLSVKLRQRLFAGTPYAHDALGTKDSFENTTAAMLRDFHRKWYRPNNAVVVIVGDVVPEAALSLVKKHFGAIPSRPLPKRPKGRLAPLRPATISLESDLPYGIAIVAYRLPGYSSRDYAAATVLADAVESKRGNLYALVPQGKALFARFEMNPFPEAGSGYAVVGFGREGAGPELLSSIRQVISDYAKKGVPADLVEAAKRREIAELEFQKDSLEELADAWSEAVAIEGRNSPEDDVEAVKRVTVADVNRVARQFLVSETAVTALLLPKPSGKPVPGGAPARGKESFAPQKVQPTELLPWVKKLTTTLPKPLHEPKISDFRMPNGLRLIVIPTSSSETVSVHGAVKNEPDLETPAGKEGVDEVLDSLFSYGTTSLDRLRFQAALDEIAADVTVGTSFSLKVLKGHADRGMELLAQNLIHPALPQEAFAVVRQQTAETVAGNLQSPGWLADQALHEALYPKNDPALRHPTPQTVSSLTLDDVRRYHRTVFRPELTTIVVLGRVTAEEARALVERHFGAWRGEGPVPPTDLPPVPDNPPVATVVPDASRVQDEVMLAENVGFTRAHPDYYALQLGLHVLSGGFYATRLYRDLRERTGLVYAVEAFLDAGKTRSTLGVFYGCDPAQVGKARLLVERNFEQMQATPVSERELMQAKTLLMRQILLGQTSTKGIAAQMLHFSLLDLPLNELSRAARRYAGLDAAEVRRVFATWLRPRGFAQVTRGR